MGGHDIDILRPSAMMFEHSFVGTFDENGVIVCQIRGKMW